MSKRSPPSASTVQRIRRHVENYWRKSGTSPHPDPAITEVVITGLASNMEEVGRPLCPCNSYPDEEVEIRELGRRWPAPATR